MAVRRGVESTTTAIAALCLSLARCLLLARRLLLALCLSLALCLAGCASPDGGLLTNSPSPASPAQGSASSTQEPVAAPVPVPQPAPPPSINSASPSATQISPGPPSALPLPDTDIPAGPAAYFVAIGDGGSRGVRFGCDDSLVAVRFPAVTGSDPLAAAMGQLLAPNGTNAPAGLYNALSGSALRYVSGYLDGSTAVVNLTGSVYPGSVCDNTRIEAQLTQTAVTATGASESEIYIDGTPLTEVLSLH